MKKGEVRIYSGEPVTFIRDLGFGWAVVKKSSGETLNVRMNKIELGSGEEKVRRSKKTIRSLRKLSGLSEKTQKKGGEEMAVEKKPEEDKKRVHRAARISALSPKEQALLFRSARVRSGLTRAQVAYSLGVCEASVRNWERRPGKKGLPKKVASRMVFEYNTWVLKL